MPTKTFYMNGTTGAMMFADYNAAYEAYGSTILGTMLANPMSNIDKISFHTDFDFIRIKQIMIVPTVSFAATNRQYVSWSSGGCCFITTACCEYKGLPDNCYELETLRSFRDKYMMGFDEGKKDVLTYYREAPILVEKLRLHPDYTAIYEKIYDEFILKAIKQYENDEWDMCHKTYRDLFEYVKGEVNVISIST